VSAEYVSNYTDVDRRVDAGEWVAKDAEEMARAGWELVSFSICQHMSGAAYPLPGAAVFAVYRRDT